MGLRTIILDTLIFNKIRNLIIGKRMRVILCGGAILSKEVQEFIQVVLCPIIQAYGLTETCGGGTTQLPNQTETG